MSQEGDGADSEQALVTDDNDTKRDESLEEELEMLQVLLLIHGFNEDIIQIDKYKIKIQEAHMHQPLHRLG